MMEAVSTSETSVNFYQTARRNIQEDCRSHVSERATEISVRSAVAETVVLNDGNRETAGAFDGSWQNYSF
jgi:hypothetical protein